MEIQISFTTERIVIPALTLPDRESGACVDFQGVVRELEKGRVLAGLRYEAYESMARRQMRGHFVELGAVHPCTAVCLIHRLGWVPVGETSLFLRVISAHRGEALAMCAGAIERLKRDVPIWKLAE